MFYLNKDIELTPDLLSKMIKEFNAHKIVLAGYKDYYDGNQAIKSKTQADPTKPNNIVMTNFCKNIADSYCGYLAAPGHISYTSEQDIEEIMDVLRYNDYQDEDSDFLLDALVYGTAAELMYIDADSKTRFKTINPTTCFGIFDDSLSEDLMYFVRIYKVNDWSDSNTYNVDVYSDYDVKHFTMKGENGSLSFVGQEPHYFSQCPANIFMLPDEKSIFDCIISLQDNYNNADSREADSKDEYYNSYLGIFGVDLEQTDVGSMREQRVLVFPDSDADAKWITKQGDESVKERLDRDQASIYRIAACPDFSSESFVGGVSSGIAIQYRLTGMETRAAKIEASMKKALQRRIEIICGIASLKIGEEIFRDIQINFKRNIPEDPTAKATEINAYRGFVSDKTLLGQVDFITDVNAEIEQIQAEKVAAADSLYNNFTLNTSPIDEEEDDEV